uniref:LRAT domain-containing protein n=1 Tax=Panagrolaimus davidi TaxID=227884 RepID=A0A914QP24_9BILA
MVAHYTNVLNNNPGSSFAFSSNVSSTSSSNALIVRFNEFVLSQEQEVRIVVHCFRRRSRDEICQTARELVANNYRRNGYRLLRNNCQHFATLCVTGKEFLTDSIFSFLHSLF